MGSEMCGKQELDCRRSLLCPICLSFISLFASIYLLIDIFQLTLLSLFANTKLLCKEMEISVVSSLVFKNLCVLLFKL